MKIRSDFVTNSSSSSFIVAHKSKEAALEAVLKEVQGEYGTALFRNIQNTENLSEEELNTILAEEGEAHASYVLCMGEGCWWSLSKDTFENRWKKANPDKDYCDMIQSEEYQTEAKKISDKYIADIKEKLKDDNFIIELSYSDNDGEFGCTMEHDIMPRFSCTKAIFNHH